VWADIFVDAQVDIVSNDNVSYGNHDKDRVSDKAIVFSGIVGHPMPLGDGMFSPSLSMEYATYKTYPRFNHGWLKAGLSFKDKLGVGDVPWYTLSAKLGYKYSAEDLRDATWASIGIGLGKHITEDLTLSANYSYEVENAAHIVFDSKRKIMGIRGDYLLTDDLMVLVSYTQIKGDVAANMYPNGHIIADVNSVYVADPVFGAGRASYRLSDETLEATMLGINYYVDENTAVEASYEQRKGAVLKTIWSNYVENLYTLSYIVSY